jgi:hypothetical protein
MALPREYTRRETDPVSRVLSVPHRLPTPIQHTPA